MFEQLVKIEAHYEEIAQRLCENNVLADAALYASLMKEYKGLTPLVEEYRSYCRAQKDLEEAKGIK